jgi:two-component system sensor histidine kinase PilS (NtrC family)
VRGQAVREMLDSVLLEPSRSTPGRRTAGWRGSTSRTSIPDGGSRDLGVSVSPLATARAGQRGYLLVFQDLTEIRRREREVRLREKLAAVGEMAAHLAHEIRNPLGSISGSAQVLMSEGNMSPSRSSCSRSSPRSRSVCRTRSTSSCTRRVPRSRGARWTWAA